MSMDSHAEILGLWPSLNDVATDVGARLVAVRKWRARNSIPAEYWLALVQAAERRGISGVTLMLLARIAAGASFVDEVA